MLLFITGQGPLSLLLLPWPGVFLITPNPPAHLPQDRGAAGGGILGDPNKNQMWLGGGQTLPCQGPGD